MCVKPAGAVNNLAWTMTLRRTVPLTRHIDCVLLKDEYPDPGVSSSEPHAEGLAEKWEGVALIAKGMSKRGGKGLETGHEIKWAREGQAARSAGAGGGRGWRCRGRGGGGVVCLRQPTSIACARINCACIACMRRHARLGAVRETVVRETARRLLPSCELQPCSCDVLVESRGSARRWCWTITNVAKQPVPYVAPLLPHMCLVLLSSMYAAVYLTFSK